MPSARWPARPCSSNPTPRTLRRDGREETVWLTFCYKPVLGEDGAVAGMFGTVTAVSSDARAEERLRESEERFRLIADSRAGADVGDQARPQAQLRQPRLCRLPRHHLRGGGRLSTGARSSIPTTTTRIARRIDRRRGHARDRSCWRRASAAATANGAGCARSRSRAGGRAASMSASSASPTTSPNGS